MKNTANLLDSLRRCTSAELEQRLRDLIAEEKAIVALIRAVRARERVMKRRTALQSQDPDGGEGIGDSRG